MSSPATMLPPASGAVSPTKAPVDHEPSSPDQVARQPLTPAPIPDDDGTDLAPQPLAFERRRNERWPSVGRASMIRVAGERFGEIFDVNLLDYSPGGFGAISDMAIEPGALVSIGFDDPGRIARRGTVLNCQPCGSGYRIAVRFERALAA